MSREFDAFQKVAQRIQEVGGDDVSVSIGWNGDGLRVNVRGRREVCETLRRQLDSFDPAVPVEWDDAPVPAAPAHGGLKIKAEESGTITAWAWSTRHHCVVLLASGHVLEGRRSIELILDDSLDERVELVGSGVQLIEEVVPGQAEYVVVARISSLENSREIDAAYLQPLAADDTNAGTAFRPVVCDREGRQLGWAIFGIAQPERGQDVALVAHASAVPRRGRITHPKAEVTDRASRVRWENVVVAEAIDHENTALSGGGDSGALLFLQPQSDDEDVELEAVGIVSGNPKTWGGLRLVAIPMDAVFEKFGLATLAIGPFASFVHHAFRGDTDAPFHFYKRSRPVEDRYPTPDIGYELLALLDGDSRFSPVAQILKRKRASLLHALVTYRRGIRLEIHSILRRLFSGVPARALNGRLEELIPEAFAPERRSGVSAALEAFRTSTPALRESVEGSGPLVTGNETLRKLLIRLALLNVLESRPLDDYEAGLLARIFSTLREVLELRAEDGELFGRIAEAFRLGQQRTICAIFEGALRKQAADGSGGRKPFNAGFSP